MEDAKRFFEPESPLVRVRRMQRDGVYECEISEAEMREMLCNVLSHEMAGSVEIRMEKVTFRMRRPDFDAELVSRPMP